MRYFYAANAVGAAYCNFTPSLSNIPALAEHAEKSGNPTQVWTAKQDRRFLRPRWRRCSGYVVSILRAGTPPTSLGTTTASFWRTPGSNKTKVLSKQERPRLDRRLSRGEPPGPYPLLQAPGRLRRRRWDNIDLMGFAGIPVQMKINFLV